MGVHALAFIGDFGEAGMNTANRQLLRSPPCLYTTVYVHAPVRSSLKALAVTLDHSEQFLLGYVRAVCEALR